MGFKIWADKGICKVADLSEKNIFMSFDNVQQKYDMQTKHLFKYLQIKSFIFKTHKSLSLPSLTSMEEASVNHNSKRGLISVDGSQVSSENKSLAWSDDLKTDISVEDWEGVYLKAQTQSIKTQFKLIQFKWLMRTYITPIRVNILHSTRWESHWSLLAITMLFYLTCVILSLVLYLFAFRYMLMYTLDPTIHMICHMTFLAADCGIACIMRLPFQRGRQCCFSLMTKQWIIRAFIWN